MFSLRSVFSKDGIFLRVRGTAEQDLARRLVGEDIRGDRTSEVWEHAHANLQSPSIRFRCAEKHQVLVSVPRALKSCSCMLSSITRSVSVHDELELHGKCLWQQ